MDEISGDSGVQVCYQNDAGDIKAVPQLATMKQASAEIRALNKQLGINDQAAPAAPERKASVLQLVVDDRAVEWWGVFVPPFSWGKLGVKQSCTSSPPADLHDFTGDAQQLKHVSNMLRSSGQYAPWSDEKISEQLKSSIISKWKGSSPYVRHNVQYKDGKTGHGSQMFDDWLNSGAYEKTIYRGTRMTGSDYAKISGLSKGQLVNQNGPASFSKSESVAKNSATSWYYV